MSKVRDHYELPMELFSDDGTGITNADGVKLTKQARPVFTAILRNVAEAHATDLKAKLALKGPQCDLSELSSGLAARIKNRIETTLQETSPDKTFECLWTGLEELIELYFGHAIEAEDELSDATRQMQYQNEAEFRKVWREHTGANNLTYPGGPALCEYAVKGIRLEAELADRNKVVEEILGPCVKCGANVEILASCHQCSVIHNRGDSDKFLAAHAKKEATDADHNNTDEGG